MLEVDLCVEIFIQFQDKKANLLIHSYVDDVMVGVMKGLGLEIPEFNKELYLSITTKFPDEKLKIEFWKIWKSYKNFEKLAVSNNENKNIDCQN